MNSVTLFDELCRIASTLESLTIALTAIVQNLDRVIDQSVEAEILTTEAEVA